MGILVSSLDFTERIGHILCSLSRTKKTFHFFRIEINFFWSGIGFEDDRQNYLVFFMFKIGSLR